MFKIFKDIKEIFRDLDNYRKYYQTTFFTLKRINRLIFKSFYKTRNLWILTILIILILFKPYDFEPNSSYIYIFQITLFVLFSFFIMNFFIVLYKYFTDEYNNYFVDTYKSFVRIMRFFTLLSIILVISFIGNLQIKFINDYLNPKLESCTYYNWYGEILFASSEVGVCPDLENLEVQNDNKISFEVHYKNYLRQEYEHHKFEYIYENEKLIKKNTYYYDENNILKLGDHITNTYSEKQFTSLFEFSQSPAYIITSTLNEDNSIITVTIDNFEGNEPEELYKIKRFYSDDTLIDYRIENFLTVMKHMDYYEENYKVGILNREYQEITLKRIVYDKLKIDSNTELKTISYAYVNNTHYRFKPEYDYQTKKIRILNESSNYLLIYKHLFLHTEYGYKIFHYSYNRDKSGKFINNNNLCYASRNYNNKYKFTDYNWGNYYLYTPWYITSCGDNIFYTKNPLLLEY